MIQYILQLFVYLNTYNADSIFFYSIMESMETDNFIYLFHQYKNQGMNSSYIIRQDTDKLFDTQSQYYQPKKISYLFSSHVDQSYCNTSTKYTKTQSSFYEQEKKYKKQLKFAKGFKFGNQQRFLKSNSDYEDICQLNIPDGKSKLSSSMGFGKRYPISKVVMKIAHENPSPDKYDYRSLNISTCKRGRSFSSTDRDG